MFKPKCCMQCLTMLQDLMDTKMLDVLFDSYVMLLHVVILAATVHVYKDLTC